MNLHILPDSKFSQVFYQNIQQLGLLEKNKFVVRSNARRLRSIEADLPFAKAGSSRFLEMVGDTLQYDKVFIHNFSPVLYRWVATNSFRELNWMIWGADLYNLAFIKFEPLEEQTKKIHTDSSTISNWLYELKVRFTAEPYRERAYAKVKRVLTWMKSEYNFARINIPSLQASYEDFFYENQVAYGNLTFAPATKDPVTEKFFLLGNSGYAVNNHLDAIEEIKRSGKRIRLKVPVSYGDASYISTLKKTCARRGYSDMEFVDQYMSGSAYIEFLGQSDGLIMNTIRPQGYGNIFLMMALGKPVYFNPKNVSLPDLVRLGISPVTLDRMGEHVEIEKLRAESSAVKSHFSHERLIHLYSELFDQH